jgi:thioredoxin-like negative regulator of GroEL/thiol-disulfide isomerase/thioredoxin
MLPLVTCLRPPSPLSFAASIMLVGALACSEAHEQHRGPEFHFGPAPERPISEPHVLPDAVAGPAAGPGVRADGSVAFAVEWFEGGFEQALAQAQADDKLLFLDVGAYWCTPCHELDEKTFIDPRVGAWLAKHALALHIDAEKGEGPELVKRYQVQAYPTMLLLEKTGVEKGRLIDFIPPDELLPKLDELAKGGNVFAELEAAVTAKPDDIKALYRLGHAYVLAARRNEAEQTFAQVLAGDLDNAKGFASQVFFDLSMFGTLKLDNDPESAIRELEQLQKKYPDSPEATKAYRIIGRALCQLGRPDEAAAALTKMVETDPNDVALKASFGWFAFRENCRPDAGLQAVLAGIPQSPEDAELRYLEAELRRLVGEPELALTAIRKASELEPDSAYYRRQVRRFEALAAGKPEPKG